MMAKCVWTIGTGGTSTAFASPPHVALGVLNGFSVMVHVVAPIFKVRTQPELDIDHKSVPVIKRQKTFVLQSLVHQ